MTACARRARAARAACLAAACAVAVCLAACGGGEDSAATGGNGSSPTTNSTADSATVTTAPEAGVASRRSAGFRGGSGPLGDLPEYGVEGSSSDRGEAQHVLDGYLGAAAKGDWDAACRYLTAEIVAQVQQLTGEGAPGRCGAALRAYLAAAAPTVDLGDHVGIAVVSFRTEAGAGFGLIHDENEDLWVAFQRESGGWKLHSLVPKPL